MWKIRPVEPQDVRQLWLALKIAANWNHADLEHMPEITNHPVIRRYVEDWGRPNDAGVLAETDRGDFAGACWYRLFAPGEVYGAVDATSPALSIGVLPEHRGKGLGTRLLNGALQLARQSGFSRVGLSVSLQNAAAISLYEAAGFEAIATEHGSQDMVLDLDSTWSPND